MRYLVGLVCVLALGVMPLAGCSETSGTGGSGADGGAAGDGGAGGVGGGGAGGDGGAGGTDLCEGVTCEDAADACTDEICNPLDGTCDSISIDCSDDNQCTEDSCDPSSGCQNPPLQDGELCVVWDYVCHPDEYFGYCGWEPVDSTCLDGFCEGICDDVHCEDFNECSVIECSPANGACTGTPIPDGTPCAGGSCLNGNCDLASSVLPCTEQGIRNAIAAGGGPYTFDCDGPTTIMTEAVIVIDNDVVLDGEGDVTVDPAGPYAAFWVAEGANVELVGFKLTGAITTAIGNDGTLEVKRCSWLENEAWAFENRGVLSVVDSSISGNRLSIFNQGRLTIRNSIISENLGQGISTSGAESSSSVENSEVSDNEGPGISVSEFGNLRIVNSTIARNGAPPRGFPRTEAGISADAATVELIGTTVSENERGIYVMGSDIKLVNSTVSGNEGPGIWIDPLGGATVFLVNSTIANNMNPDGGSAIHVGEAVVNTPPSILLRASLIAGDCGWDPPSIPTFESIVTSFGHNIESPGDTCGFDQATDQVNVTAEQLNVGPLADNGGPTMTHALGAGSVAIDVIPEAECADADGAPLTTDQRGVMRPQGDACDVGAVEMEVAP